MYIPIWNLLRKKGEQALSTYKQFITNWQIRHFPISHGNLLLKNGIVMQQRTNTILLYSKH